MKERNMKNLLIFIIISIILLLIGLGAIYSSITIQNNDENILYENDLSYMKGSIKQNIEDLEYNNIEYIHIADKQMAEKYFEDYINLVQNDTKEAYRLLDENYKIKKFETYEIYDEFIHKNIKFLRESELKNVVVDSDENYKNYICKDQYGNTYLFKETAVMDYTVQLDDYTLENISFDEKYNEANARDKGILNVDKFFKMINMQDYTSAYAVLDENFKQNYFKTQTEFENYIKNKVFRYNKVDYKEYSNKITDIYTYKVVLTDITGEKQGEVEFNIVMKLLEGTEFVMSFTVN